MRMYRGCVDSSLGSALWLGFRRSYGPVSILVGFAMSLGAWLVPLQEQSIPLRTVIGFGVSLLTVAAILIASLLTAVVDLHNDVTVAVEKLRLAALAVPALPRALFGTSGADDKAIVLLEGLTALFARRWHFGVSAQRPRIRGNFGRW
jgi:hypothetical protein